MKHDVLLQSAIFLTRPVAAMYLAFPAGESHSEAVFSCTTAIVTKKRTNLSDFMIEALTIIREYLSQDGYSFEELLHALTKYLEQEAIGESGK